MNQTFTLTITGAEHGEWQGTISEPNRSNTEFQSVMELLIAIQAKLEETS